MFVKLLKCFFKAQGHFPFKSFNNPVYSQLEIELLVSFLYKITLKNFKKLCAPQCTLWFSFSPQRHLDSLSRDSESIFQK